LKKPLPPFLETAGLFFSINNNMNIATLWRQGLGLKSKAGKIGSNFFFPAFEIGLVAIS
jgi:hypothetical protein